MSNVLLLQIDRGHPWNHLAGGIYVNLSAGIYYVNFDGEYPLVDDTFEEEMPTLEVTIIGTVYAGLTRLAKVETIEGLFSEPSFCWQPSTKNLYMRLPDFDHPRLHNMTLGISMLIRHGGMKEVYDGLHYEDRLVSLPRVGRQRDRLFFGRLSYDNARITIANTDGAFDGIRDYDLYNQGARFYLGDDSMDAVDEFTQKGDFRIDVVTIGQRRLTIEASDPRKELSTPIPASVFLLDEYSDLDEGDENKPIPLGYGRNRKRPVVCVNRGIYDRDLEQTLSFRICDTTHHAIKEIAAVYHGDSELSVVNENTASASFDYIKAAGEEIDFDRITVSYSGYIDDSDELIENPVDIIVDLLEHYADRPYTSVNYDTTEIALEKPKMWACALHLDRVTTIGEAVERLVSSTLAQFIVLDDNRYTFRKRDTTKAIAAMVDAWEILNLRDIELTFDTDEFLSSCLVVYNNGLRKRNASYESEVTARFRRRREKEFKIDLVDEVDADSFSEEIMLSSKDLLPPIALKLPRRPEFESLQIGDLIGVYLPRLRSEWQGHLKCEIEGAFIDPMAFQEDIRARVLESGDGFEIVLDGGEAGDNVTDSIDGGSAGDATIIGIVTGGAAA